MSTSVQSFITQEQIDLIQKNVYIVHQTIFFTRLADPTEATIDYCTAYMLGLVKKHNITSMSIDLRGSKLLEYKLRKRIFMQLLQFQDAISHLYMIRQPDTLFLVAVNFGFRILSFQRVITWSIHDSPEDVIAQLEQNSNLPNCE